MKKQFINLMALVTMLAFVACDGNKKTEDDTTGDDTANADEQQTEKTCTYTYVHDSTAVSWTAYKFTEKVGVGGKFDSCHVEPEMKAGSISEILNNLEFVIPVNKSNSNNEDRDKKILEHFWGTMLGTEAIKGVISEVSEKDNGGTATVGLVMNEVEQAVNAFYQIAENGAFTLTATVNMANFDAQPAVDKLNEICKELHTTNGVSKLWPDVDVVVKGYLKKECK
ncbi:MAG: YceI family protein [Bacteroidetes bacterium]|nr:YceI family protein [Bacteroidota bacterium]